MAFPTELLDAPDEPRPAPVLTDEQRAQLAELKTHFSAEGYTLPVAEGKDERSPLTEREMMFLSQETFLRFLRATKKGVQPTAERLERAIVWRRTAGVDDVDTMERECENESRMGKHFVMGFTGAMPVMYLFPARNSLPLEERRVVHPVFMVERATDLMAHGETQLLLILNFAGKREGPPTSYSAARETMFILGEYYPEVLGQSIVTDMPWYLRAFVSLVWPFVDAHTRTKFKICTGPQAVKDGHVRADVLLKECGGDLHLPYDHEAYWPTFLRVCRERREEHHRRWRALGDPAVGHEERLFKLAPGAA